MGVRRLPHGMAPPTLSGMASERKTPYLQGIQGAELTQRQRDFVAILVRRGCTQTEAAREAGYSSPRTAAHDLLKMPHVQAAIQFETFRYIQCEMVGLATATLREVMADEDSPAAARVAAARTVLEASGEIGKGRKAGLDEDRPMSNLDAEELSRMIHQWEGERLALQQAA